METQQAFFYDLKQLRVAQGIGLEDISATTRINVRFLEALEDGNFDILPMTYIRLFLRSYCEQIGAEFGEVVKQLEDYVGVSLAQPVPEVEDATLPPMVRRHEFPSAMPDKTGSTPKTSARTRQDLITGAVVLVFLVLLTVFARRAYQDATGSVSPTEVGIVAENPVNPQLERISNPAAREGNGQPVVPTESTVDFPNSKFTSDRISANVLERVRVVPPVRLTLMARDNVVIQPITDGLKQTAFNLTVAEARIMTIRDEILLRTDHIGLLRGDINGVPLNFGQASGWGSLRITPEGVYEITAYADPEVLSDPEAAQIP